MSNEPKRDVNKILSDMGESVSKLAKSIMDLAKVGAGKAQDAIEDYQKAETKTASKAKKKKED